MIPIFGNLIDVAVGVVRTGRHGNGHLTKTIGRRIVLNEIIGVVAYPNIPFGIFTKSLIELGIGVVGLVAKSGECLPIRVEFINMV